MTIIVKQEIGREKTKRVKSYLNKQGDGLDSLEVENIGKSYPAPRLPDGEHEAQLVWQQSDEDGDGKTIWKRCYNPLLATSDTRQIWVLSTPPVKEGERSGVNSTELIQLCKNAFDGFIAEQKRNGLEWSDNPVNYELFSTGFLAGYYEYKS